MMAGHPNVVRFVRTSSKNARSCTKFCAIIFCNKIIIVERPRTRTMSWRSCVEHLRGLNKRVRSCEERLNFFSLGYFRKLRNLGRTEHICRVAIYIDIEEPHAILFAAKVQRKQRRKCCFATTAFPQKRYSHSTLPIVL